ncbi:hypothetical protein CSUB01_10766 [Colletotrichum sublineola]|uniref:Uncharacterized protein n=1 Tax=Colletotrichum sublineola TaxID=1173701 RepID=A0A066XH92_COLSU|nr:hypothetical protein CSUB01_10766 [Colletotrichum sublineola]
MGPFSYLFTLILLAAFSFAHEAETHDINSSLYRKRALDGYFVVDRADGDEIGCSDSQIGTLRNAVVEAKYLAQKASHQLAQPGSERSAAYLKWFGRQNANAAMKKAIKEHNYDSVAYVQPPSEPHNRIHDADLDKLSPTGLTFVCIPQDFSLCAPGEVAKAFQIGDLSNAGPLVALCPRFFHCEHINDRDKIRNAQNMAYFALDVTVNRS